MTAADRIKELTRPTGQEDLLPVAYPPPRVRIAPKQALAAAAVALVCVGGWALTRPEPVASPEWDTVAAVTTVPERVVVAVVGEVEQPGLVTLDAGSRVADALREARPFPHADLISVNQAQVLVDGQQIHVQAVGAAPPPEHAPGGAGTSTGRVSLNQASAAELTGLPGIGQSTAAAIVAHREANGPFATVESLMDVKGIGPAKFEAIKDLVDI